MGSTMNWLVTVLYGDQFLRCALQVDRDMLEGDCADYPMELENCAQIHALLPLHVRNCGPIVAIDEIFEVHISDGQVNDTKGG
jgi:hypothetical protein